MAKRGQLWDDSALIKAFDDAIDKYKVMHERQEDPISKKDENLAVFYESGEVHSDAAHFKNGDEIGNMSATADETEAATNLSQIKEDFPVKLSSSVQHASSLSISTSELPVDGESFAMHSGNPGELLVLAGAKSFQDDTACSSKSPEEYNNLLTKYYELEDQRQKILLQLQQFGNWSGPNQVSRTPTAHVNEAAPTQPLYDTVACYCSYGCQNWVIPCNSLPSTCSSCTCIDKINNTISEVGHEVISGSHKDPDFSTAATVAAERTMSSFMNEASINANRLAKEEKGNEDRVQIGQFSNFAKSPTDLDMVLNAWYSAGFYTGKYVAENSFSERSKHSQDH